MIFKTVDQITKPLVIFASTYPLGAFIGSFVIFSWVFWRIWRFSIQPLVYPKDPREMPYWIPSELTSSNITTKTCSHIHDQFSVRYTIASCSVVANNLGHGKAFFNNADKLITEARYVTINCSLVQCTRNLRSPFSLYFGDTRQPFTLVAGGINNVIITSPKDATEAFKNSKTLSMDIFLEEVMQACGASKDSRTKMFQSPLETGRSAIFPNPKQNALARLSKDMHNHQLLPGPRLDGITENFINTFQHQLEVSSIRSNRYCQPQPHSDGSFVVSFYDWISTLFVEAGQIAYFGEDLGRIDPNFIETFLKFDHLSWQFLYRLPNLLCPDVHSTKEKMIASLTTYFELPEEQRTGDVWFTKAYERELRASGVSTQDIAMIYMLIYWG